jgi:outer membrane protein OmpA-like peptidoglycan-associated protein
MRYWVYFWCGLAVIVMLAACGHRNMVILIPDPDGAVGQITVSNAAGSVKIDQANQATIVKDAETAPDAPAQLEPDKIQKLFAGVLSAEPPPPMHFILHFQSDSVKLLAEARQLLPEIVSEFQQRVPTRVSVVGHTDTLGDKAYNVGLSMRRALAVKRLLIEAGVDGAAIDVSSHGEENPLVKTTDNVANAKNRRVEVIIR